MFGIGLFAFEAEHLVEDLAKLCGETKVDEKANHRALNELEYVDEKCVDFVVGRERLLGRKDEARIGEYHW